MSAQPSEQPTGQEQTYYAENVLHNAKQTYYVRSTVASVSGSVAGILGLTNLKGFYFYLVSSFLSTLAILLVNCKGRPSRYIPSSSGLSSSLPVTIFKLMTEGLQDNLFSFVLWWTFWFGIIHVYD